MSIIGADELTEIFRREWNRSGQIRTAMVMIESTIEARVRKLYRKRAPNIVRQAAHRAVDLHPVVIACAREWNVKPKAIVGPAQYGAPLAARGDAAFALRLMKLSYPVIGAMINRDHSSVMGLVRKVTLELREDPRRAQRLVAIAAGTAERRAA